jgi:lipopolysaccharide transport system permease protein
MKPQHIFSSLWQYRVLIKHMVLREIASRYKGSLLGLLWAVINPILMLAVYTFFFSVVFQSRWTGAHSSAASGSNVGGGQFEFAIVLYAGLLVFNLFSECIARAPSLILSNANYVKKVIFPLEVLPWISLGSALFHLLIGFGVILVFIAVAGMPLHSTVLLFPLVLLPLIPMVMGLSWLLSSVGVYFRDIGQIIGMALTALMFLSPIFYPVTALPESMQGYLLLNPLTFVIEQTRNVLVWGVLPNWSGLLSYSLVSMGVSWLGLLAFKSMRAGFADVL